MGGRCRGPGRAGRSGSGIFRSCLDHRPTMGAGHRRPAVACTMALGINSREECGAMAAWAEIEQAITHALSLSRRPIGVAFRQTPPAGVAAFSGTEPSGCSFWRVAAAGRTFYTVPSDHYNCAIGSHTHAIPLPAERAQELEQTLSFMTGIGYVKMEEVPGIPRLSATPGAVVYAPLGDSPV